MATDNNIKVEEFIRAIKHDPSLSDEERELANEKLNEPSFFNRLVYGGFGAGVAAAISNWIKLSKKAKIVLALAGFGVGQLILTAVSKEDKPLKYNNATKTYDVQ